MDEGVTLCRFPAKEGFEGLIRAGGILNSHLQSRPAFGIHGCFLEFRRIHLPETFKSLNGDSIGRITFKQFILVCLPVYVADTLFFLFPDLNPVQGRLGQVNVPLFYQFLHIAIEKGEEQGGYVKAINVRIAVDEDFAIAQPAVIELIANPCAYTPAKRLDFLVLSYLIGTGLFYV